MSTNVGPNLWKYRWALKVSRFQAGWICLSTIGFVWWTDGRNPTGWVIGCLIGNVLSNLTFERRPKE